LIVRNVLKHKMKINMKKNFILFAIMFSLWAQGAYAQSTDITPSGIIVPRLTTTQRNAIASPSTGQLIYNTDEGCFNIYTQTSVWQSLCAFDRPLSNTWIRKADLPNGDRRDGVGFSIGSKGYIGLGAKLNSGRLSDFWEYDPIADAYTQKADFPDGARAFAVGFAIGNKGYVGTGFVDNNIYKKDFWEYNPASNVWTQKADFGGTARTLSVGFAIGNKGYIGTGLDVSNNNTNDFWEYDPTSNQWTQKANLGTADSTIRREAFGLSIGNKGYIGGGFFFGNTTTKLVPNDFWEYDPASNQWTEKANIPNTLDTSFKLIRRAMAFSIFDKGFICGGYHANGGPGGGLERNSAQEYNPVTNQWTRIADFGGGIRHSGVAFTIANKGYVGFGVRFAVNIGATYNDLWTYGGSAEVTQQGNSFNQANQLVKLDAFGNLAISGMVVSEPFINATLSNGWSNYGLGFATAAYYKDKQGIVHLKGLVKNGTGTIFTLPEGYRTLFSLRFNVLNSDAYGQINIIGFNGGLTGIGEVNVVAGGNAFVSLNGISFRADR
jgi:hypothetical protein